MGLAQQNYRIIWYDRRFLHFFWLNNGFCSIWSFLRWRIDYRAKQRHIV